MVLILLMILRHDFLFKNYGFKVRSDAKTVTFDANAPASPTYSTRTASYRQLHSLNRQCHYLL